jgi:hypothetical protein
VQPSIIGYDSVQGGYRGHGDSNYFVKSFCPFFYDELRRVFMVGRSDIEASFRTEHPIVS